MTPALEDDHRPQVGLFRRGGKGGRAVQQGDRATAGAVQGDQGLAEQVGGGVLSAEEDGGPAGARRLQQRGIVQGSPPQLPEGHAQLCQALGVLGFFGEHQQEDA